jgi:hypothetical protein
MRFTTRPFGCALRRALYWELYRRISSLTVGVWRYLGITVLVTYQGASTIMRRLSIGNVLELWSWVEFQIKDRTMDNIQNCDTCINKPTSQTCQLKRLLMSVKQNCWTGLDGMKIFPLPGLELRLLGHQARSQSLYRLSYPGVFVRTRYMSPLTLRHPVDHLIYWWFHSLSSWITQI